MIPEFLIPVVLILQLGSADYRIRELATAKLGDRTTDYMVYNFGRRQARKDLEIKRRLRTWLATPAKYDWVKDYVEHKK